MFTSTRKFLRQCFLAGLLTLIPLVATFWILKVLVDWAQDFFFGFVPRHLHPSALLGYDIPGVGLAFTLLLILLVGMIARSYLVTRVIALGELLVARIPIARGVYPGIKRLMQLLVGDQAAKASQVVLVPYPHEHSKAYAFVTGEQLIDGEPHLRVFVPTSPNPTSGFLLIMPTVRTMATTLTIDEASKLIVSGGLV